MKKIQLYILFFFIHVGAFSQASTDIGKIAIGVVMPDQIEGLDATLINRLENKVTQIVSQSGVGASGYNNTFVIYPKISINENNVVEGGMQNINVMAIELSLFIKQVDNNLVFSSVTKQLKGVGANKIQALGNAITKISSSDPEFVKFIELGKNNIIKYYQTNCDKILQKADTYSKQKKFDEGLGLLMTVPEEVSDCYVKIQGRAIELYKLYQNQICNELIINAKAKIASNNNSAALDILSKIDPSASCIKEAQLLIAKVESKVSSEEKKQWDFKMKQYNDATNLEKMRINAVKEIAVSHYKNQPKTVNYLYIVQ
jgi:hypothetical protein